MREELIYTEILHTLIQYNIGGNINKELNFVMCEQGLKREVTVWPNDRKTEFCYLITELFGIFSRFFGKILGRNWLLHDVDVVVDTRQLAAPDLRLKMYRWAMATTGAPVGVPGNGPEDPAMSRWVNFSGLSESMPCYNTKHKWVFVLKCKTVQNNKETSNTFSASVHLKLYYRPKIRLSRECLFSRTACVIPLKLIKFPYKNAFQ